MKTLSLLFLFLISLSSYASDKSSIQRNMVISKDDIASIDEFNGSTYEEFMSSYGQFEILIPKERFVFRAPNCRQNIKLRMYGILSKAKNRQKLLEYHWQLLQEFRTVAKGEKESLTVPIDPSPYMKLDKNGEPILQYCNAFIPSDFWKYSPGKDEKNAPEKSVEKQNKQGTK